MQRWEYCVIYDDKITYFLEEGPHTCSISFNKNGLAGSEKTFFAAISPSYKFPEKEIDPETLKVRLIYAMGKDGWELVGIGSWDEFSHAQYFKRPIEG